jgi:hypothetical protein
LVKSSLYKWLSRKRASQAVDGLIAGAVLLLAVIVLFADTTATQEREPAAVGTELNIAQLKSLFRSPPNDRRILKIIHIFPKDVARNEGVLKDLRARGFGGVVCNVHFDEYLRSEENWKSFIHAVRLAKQMGMTLWLYDEKGYPSGGAGGLVLDGHPEWEARGVACVSTTTEGSSVEMRLPNGKIVSVSAFPVEGGRIDLRRGNDLRNLVAEGAVKWQPPEGQWIAMAFVEQTLYEGTHAQWNLFEKRPYPNILMKEPLARFIELTHAEYARRFSDLDRTFDAIFTDEPSLMSVFLRPQPHPVVPWSPDLPARFREQTGRDLIPLLPALFADAGPESQRARCEFWRVVGEMVSDAYFGQIQNWCRAHGIASTGHLLWEEDLAYHVGFYGNFYRCVERLDIPGIDCLTSKPATVPFHIAKLISSIAHLHGCSKTMTETSDHIQHYRPPGDTRPREPVSAAEIRGTCNLLYVCGINTTTSYYSWEGLTVEEQRAVNQYVGRLGVMLTGGTHVCDVAVLYPTESLWAHFVPAPSGATNSPELAAIDRTYREVSSVLFRSQLDYVYLDSSALRLAKLSGNRLDVADERYRVLVLPRVDTLPLDVYQKVAEFWRGGGIVIAVGSLPQNTPSEFPGEEMLRLTKELFGDAGEPKQGDLPVNRNARGGASVFLPSGQEPSVSTTIRSLLDSDCTVSTPGSPLRYVHRRFAGREIYFFINDSASEIEEEVTLRSAGTLELWNPNTGDIAMPEPATTDAVAAKTRLRLRIEPYGSRFITFRRSDEATAEQ